MASDEAKALQINRMANAMMASLKPFGSEDVALVMAALGSVAGCMAVASERPSEAMKMLTTIADGIISGEFLD